MFCPNCGKQLPDGVKFCTGCGAALAGPAPAPAPEPRHTAPRPAPVPEKKSRAGLVVGVIAAIAALAAGAFLIAPRLSAGGGQTGAAMDGGGQGETVSQAGDRPEYYEVIDEDGTIWYKYATAPAPQAEAVGDSWDSYTVSVNGKVITFPCTLEDFKQSGLVIRAGDSENRQVEAREKVWCTYVANEYEGDGLSVIFVNGSDEAKPLSQCLVAGIDISVDPQPVDIALTVPGGIQAGRSTRQDVLDAYGPASWEDPGDAGDYIPRDFYRWQAPGSDIEENDVYVYIDARTDLVQEISIYRGIYFGGEAGA